MRFLPGRLHRTVVMLAAGCPRYGVVDRPHERRPYLVRDIPLGGRPVVLMWSKRLWRCGEPLGPGRTWPETSGQIQARAVLTELRGNENTRHLTSRHKRGGPPVNPPELDRILIPVFDFPWPGSCHSEVEDVERSMIEWGLAHQLIPDDSYHARVVRTRYGFLAARCYPRAERGLLQAIADYFLWFFLADDLFIDRVDVVTPDTIRNLTAMIDVLDLDRQGSPPVYGESAWLDVCQRLRGYLSAEHFQRFATGMRLWASTAGLQILNHVQSHPIRIGSYETIRRHTSGMNPCLTLSDAANNGPITADEYHHPAIEALRVHANNVVCWSNDIQSVALEARQPGQFRNMVTIYAAQGHTLQEGIDITARRVRSEITAFARLAETVLMEASPQLSGYIDGMKYWMRGYQDWVDHDTARYARTYAKHDSDDRPVELPHRTHGGGSDRLGR